MVADGDKYYYGLYSVHVYISMLTLHCSSWKVCNKFINNFLKAVMRTSILQYIVRQYM